VIYLLTINYNSSKLIQRLIQSLPDPNSPNYQVLIVNNSPEDQDIINLQSDNIQVLQAGKNLGFGGGCNLGIQYLAAQDHQAIIWLLNPDTYFPTETPDHYWNVLENIWLQQQKLAILGTTIVTPDGNPWFTKGLFNPKTGESKDLKLFNQDENPDQLVASDWISGCSLMLNLSRFAEIPHFDESFFLYYEDVDFCLRYRALGYAIALCPSLKIIHQASSITNANQYNKFFHSSFSYLYFLKKHVSYFVFARCLLKFLINMLIKLVLQPDIGRAKYDGLIAFIKKISVV
jgi:N-acetylglucosaminyl-diphospho-decaprenol L-rhamnosyltransferase